MKHIIRIVCLTFLPGIIMHPLTTQANDCSDGNSPNVVIILMDDMGYGDIGPFGSTINRTPHLDRMANEGMKFTSFYAAPICSASRAQLMTGCYSKRVSVGSALFPGSRIGIHSNELTIAELLKEQGYNTMMVGKWHLGDQPEFLPTRNGFDHYLGIPYSNDMGEQYKKNDDGVSVMIRPPLPLLRNETVIQAPPRQEELTGLFTREAVEFIRANKERPFFLYVAHFAPHVPMMPGDSFRGKSPHGLYSDWIEEADWSAGQIMDTLRELNLATNTLVMFTSDNGPWLAKKNASGVATPLRGGKFTSWEGGVRAPTLAWWPGKIPAGSVCDAVASEMDLLPTVASLTGGNLPADRIIDGRDIWPLLSGASTNSPHEALYYWGGLGIDGVRSGPWKLFVNPQKTGLKDNNDEVIFASRRQPLLFHLDDDVGETTNVAEQHPEVVARLLGLINEMDKDLGASGRKGSGIRPHGIVENPVFLTISTE